VNQTLFSAWFLLAGTLTAAQHSGTVRAADQFIPGAMVVATQGEVKVAVYTDDTGKYTLELTPGVWQLRVEMHSFREASRQIEVPNMSEAPAVDWVLEMPRRESAPATPETPAAPAPAPAPPVPTGFQSLAVTATAEGAAAKAEAPPVEPAAESTGTTPTESFLVSGSVSTGLEAAQKEEEQSRRREERSASSGSPSPFGDSGTPSLMPPGFSASSMPGVFNTADFAGGGSGRGGRTASGGTSKKYAKYSKRASATSFGNKRPKEGIHGSLYGTLRNSALEARPFSFTGNQAPKPSYARSYFGVSAGGPLSIPKVLYLERTFVYFTYSGSRSRSTYSAVSTLPTPLERAGDFSQSYTRWPVNIFDPDSHLPFPGNVIPASRFDRASVGLMRFMPRPNLPGRVQNYQIVTAYPSNTDDFGIRLNQPLSRHDRVNFSTNFQNRVGLSPQLYGFMDPSQGHGMSASASWSHTFAPRLTGSLSWSFSRNRSDLVPYFAFQQNVAAELGIVGTAAEPIAWGPPNLSFTNFGGLSDASASVSRNQTSVLSYGMTLVRKKHNFSFGASARWRQINSMAYQNGRGSYSFSGLMTSSFDSAGQPLAGSGYDFADFLLGYPQSSSLRFGSNNTYFRARDWSCYTQDDWRVRANLTLNFGLRYEYFAPYWEVRGRIANLDISPQWNAVAVVTPGTKGPYTGEYPAGLVNSDPNNYAPRFGLAWRPIKKKALQVRGGYGVFFNGSVYGGFPGRLASQPPFANTASLSTSTAQPLRIENGFPQALPGTITNTFAIDRNYKVGYAQTFNFSLQTSLPHNLIAEVGYLGTKGTGLDVLRVPNRAAPGSPLTAEQRRTIGNAVGFTYESSQGNSIMHAAQVRLTRRFVKGVSATAFYQFAKSIDNVSSFTSGGGSVAQDDQNLRAERGLSNFDQRHSLTASYVITSPVGETGLLRNGRKASALLRNWTLSGALSASSGTPFTARVLGNLANSGGTGVIGSGRADSSGQNVTAGNYPFFNLLAYTIPPSGRYGNAGRNTVPGLPRFTMSASFGRAFRLGAVSRRYIDFRIDSGNTLNHPYITSVYTVFNASNYGMPAAAMPMRTVNLTLRYRF
jgi:hypothetical protein